MKILKTPTKGLLVFKGQKFDDNRGYFREVLLEKLLKENLFLMLCLCLRKMLLEDFIYKRETTSKIYLCCKR